MYIHVRMCCYSITVHTCTHVLLQYYSTYMYACATVLQYIHVRMCCYSITVHTCTHVLLQYYSTYMYACAATVLQYIHVRVYCYSTYNALTQHRVIADLMRGVFYQKCHDPECKRANFRGNGKTLSLNVFSMTLLL